MAVLTAGILTLPALGMLLIVFSHGDRAQLRSAVRPAALLAAAMWVLGTLMLSGEPRTAISIALLVSGAFVAMLAVSMASDRGTRARGSYWAILALAIVGVALLAVALLTTVGAG